MLEAILIDGVAISPLHYVNGARVESDERLTVFSPIDGRELGAIAQAGPEIVAAAVEAASHAFPAWAALGCRLLAEAADAADLPPGVFNIVQGAGATTGAALVSDPRLSRISFTGSVSTAKTIAAAAAANLVPVSLELGGKSPFIVLAD